MKFSALLLALHFILKNAARKNEAFRRYIRNTSTRILIKTEDGKRGRMFVSRPSSRSVLTTRTGAALA